MVLYFLRYARRVVVFTLLVSMAALVVPADPAFAKNKKREKLLERLRQNLALISEAPDEAWRTLDPENTVLMDLPTGTVYVELRPDLAPVNAGRIRELVREGFYDGLRFHRVIEGFVAQGGDPKGDGTGGSDKPDIEAEFTRALAEFPEFTVVGRDRVAAQVGFLDGLPVAAKPSSLRSFLVDAEVPMWGIHCPGTMSMARATNPNSANSQFFFVIGDARLSLDRRYSVWGWVVHGMKHSRRIARGEPPERPTPIVRARIAADVPEEERPEILVFDTSNPRFKDYLVATGKIEDGLVRDMCDISVPVKVDGELEL